MSEFYQTILFLLLTGSVGNRDVKLGDSVKKIPTKIVGRPDPH